MMRNNKSFTKGVVYIEDLNDIFDRIMMDDLTLMNKVQQYKEMVAEKKKNFDYQLKINDKYNYLGLKIARLMYIFVAEEYDSLKREAKNRGLEIEKSDTIR